MRKARLAAKRGYLPAAAIVILALITLAVAVVIYFNRDLILKTKKDQQAQLTASSSSPTPSPDLSSETSVKEDETANWKTYTNTKDKFTLEYPSNYQMRKSNSDAAVKFYLPNAKGNTFGVMFGGGFQVLGGEFQATAEDSNKTLFEVALEQFFIRGRPNLCQETPNIKVDGADAIRCDYEPREEGKSPEDIVTVFTIKNNKSYLIHAWASGKDAKDLIKDFDQILSTFKFLD